MPAERFANLIGPEWVKFDGEFEPSVNPSNVNDVLGEFPVSDEKTVNEGVARASKAFPGWSAESPQARGEVLRKVADLLEARREEFVGLISREVGKPRRDAGAEVKAGIERLRYVAGQAHTALGEMLPTAAKSRTLWAVRVPVGVAGIITPWNYPIGMPLEKLLTALIAGNTVVLKPAEQSPMTALKLAELFEEAGLPPGVLNVVFGDATAGRALCNHPDVRLISFTGSTAVGREIAASGGRALKRTVLELGGKNALLVMDDVDLDFATEEAVYHAFGYTGQKCTAASRLFVHEKIYEPFVEKFVAKAKQLVVGDATKADTHIGPLVTSAQLDKVAFYVEKAREQGEILCGGTRLKDGPHANGYFFAPTVISGLPGDHPVLTDEIFGPVIAAVPVKSFDEGIARMNESNLGLSSGVYTNNLANAFRATREVEAGLVYVNGGPTGAEVHYPFGGIKDSGNGYREAGFPAALEAYTEWRTVVLNEAPAFKERFPGR